MLNSRRRGVLICVVLFIVCVAAVLSGLLVLACKHNSRKDHVPSVELSSMSFTVLNITETHVSAKWDLSIIRIPNDLPRNYKCLQGDFQPSLIYKNVTLATASPNQYYALSYSEDQTLTISTFVLEKDISVLVGKDIMEDIKEKKEVKFVSRFFLTDCRKNMTGRMTYACPEATLLFQSGFKNATLFGKHPRCISV